MFPLFYRGWKVLVEKLVHLDPQGHADFQVYLVYKVNREVKESQVQLFLLGGSRAKAYEKQSE